MPVVEASPRTQHAAGEHKVAGPRERAGDRAFRLALLAAGGVVILLALAMGYELAVHSRAAWEKFGASFLWSREWDPVAEKFGALPFVFGTLVSSFLALLIAVPLGVGAAIFLAEMAPRRLSDACCFLIELLAAVPSVILGLMGIFLLVPAVRQFEPWLTKALGWIPLFKGAPYGVGLLSASLILAVMVLPYITVVAREVLLAVPRPLKEAMLALGATRWEVIWGVSLPYARSGIIGAGFLSLGRALGETMAVTMVIGNTARISWSLLDPAYSMAAVIANELAEAVGDMHLQSLIAVGLVLFAITIVVNAAARLMIYRVDGGGA
ncbi:MAG: phosphate ABC transporter permease subunit PstC [Proteobacteria bacterium]|nr:phosphate ABC transporter permease subunit PstC [Pseudomonadota bacterium]